MKIIAPGTLYWTPDGWQAPGWRLDSESMLVTPREILCEILVYIAASNSIALEEHVPEPVVSLDAERLARDALTIAAWGGDPRHRNGGA